MSGLAGRLRAALGRGGGLVIGDDGFDLAAATTPAAVLVAVTRRAEPGVLLTRRQPHLRRHAGQIAFPGGRVDPGDRDATAAALREAWEEIALPPEAVEVVGTSDLYRTHTGFEVLPVVGVVAADLPLVPHAGEVAEIFEVPLAHLLARANHAWTGVEHDGRRRHYHQIEWQGRMIWGATANMIVHLARRLDGW